MNPKHISPVPKKRRAVAPYNFVELPEKVVEAQAQDPPSGDRYHSERHTGKIECTLVTESPLYIRCGLLPDDFKNFGDYTCNLEELKKLTPEEENRWTDFFYNPANYRLTIPGSSLRGMLRTLVEIVTYSKVHKVSDYAKLFFRAVAAAKTKDGDPDPLGSEYEDKLGKNANKVRAGYLKQVGKSWKIYGARDFAEYSFVKVKETSIPSNINLIRFDSPDYYPQGFDQLIPVRFDEIQRGVAQEIDVNNERSQYQGYLITSGNMKEGSPNSNSIRKYHWIIGEKTDKNYEIDSGAIEDYCAALTDFQKKHFDQHNGILKNDYPVFFCEPKDSEKVMLFGHSPNFRVPYTPPCKNGRAASSADFIPPKLKSSDPMIDMSEAIFGWVKDKKSENQAFAGRVFLTDAVIDNSIPIDQIWCQDNTDERVIPQILASPKPTTFQHYLVQDKKDNQEAKREKLKHYGSHPLEDTVIRGHKLYWHQQNIDYDRILERKTQAEIEEDKKLKQYTKIRPICAGVRFDFKIYFENLTEEEIGALLWVLNLAEDKEKRCYINSEDEYRFSLGMGKPFGMGAIKLTNQKLWLSQRREKRYKKLFDGNNYWETGDYNDTKVEAEVFVNAFKDYMKCVGKNLEDVERIKMLLKMLSFPGKATGSVRYMEIEHPHNENEYDQRPVLPNPLDV